MIAWKNGFSNSYVTSPKIKTINKQKKLNQRICREQKLT